jgi:hypothetical protein
MLVEAPIFAGIEIALRQLVPQGCIGGRARLAFIAEDAVMAADNLPQRIAHGRQEQVIGPEDRAVRRKFDHRLRTADGVPDGIAAVGVNGLAHEHKTPSPPA